MSKDYKWNDLSYLNRGYRGLHFLHPKNLKALWDVHKQRKDRIHKGWTDIDTWNWCDWFQNVVPEMLDDLAENHSGYSIIDFDSIRKSGKRETLPWEKFSTSSYDSDEEFEKVEKAQVEAYEAYLREIAQHIRNSNEELCPKKNSILEKYGGWASGIPKEEKKQYYKEAEEIMDFRQAEIEKALDMIKPIFFDLWD